MEMFQVKDLAANAYEIPWFSHTTATALRQVINTVNTHPDHRWAQFPGDYLLECIGSYDQATGVVTLLERPNQLGRMVDFIEDANGTQPEPVPTG